MLLGFGVLGSGYIEMSILDMRYHLNKDEGLEKGAPKDLTSTS